MNTSESDAVLSNLAAGKPAAGDDFIIVRRHRLVRRLAPPKGSVLLDFGCGNGAQTFLFEADFPLIVGVDVGMPHLAAMARETARRGLGGRVLSVRYDGDNLPFRSGAIDCTISFEVLEHVEHESRALAEIARVVRPGGILALSVPNRWWIFETHGANLPLLPWNRIPFFSWLPKRLHDRWARARIYERGEIERKIAAAGFTIRRSVYITAPMDVVKWQPLKRLLRRTVFRPDATPFPVLATAVLVIAERTTGTPSGPAA